MIDNISYKMSYEVIFLNINFLDTSHKFELLKKGPMSLIFNFRFTKFENFKFC